MRIGRIGMFLTTLLATGLAGCAHTPSNPPPPITSGFGSCNSCDRQPFLPRGRIDPTPVPPIGAPPTTPPPDPVPVPRGPVQEFRTYPPGEPPHAPNAKLFPPQVGEEDKPRNPADPSALPVDIPQFALARKGVASGQKPFSEGLNYLRDRGYRTALYVRLPGEDDSTIRRAFEAKGFRYLSLEVSPLTLNRKVLDEFNRIITTTENQPLFCFDRDSSLLGGLWYLHFRFHENFDADRAAIEAGRLGLNVDADGGPHRDMWLAIQKLLQAAKQTSRPSRAFTASWIRTQP